MFPGMMQANNNQSQGNSQGAANPMMLNPFFQQMMNGQMGQMQNPMQQTTPPANAREVWATQLATLVSMGFDNEQENINALTQARGNVEMSVNILMTNRGIN